MPKAQLQVLQSTAYPSSDAADAGPLVAPSLLVSTGGASSPNISITADERRARRRELHGVGKSPVIAGTKTEQRDQRRHLEQQVKEADTRLQALRLTVFTGRLLPTKHEQAVMRRYRKSAGRRRGLSDAALQDLHLKIEAFAADLLQRIPPTELAKAVAPAAGVLPAPEKKRARLPIALITLPPATLLDDLKVGRIPWSEVLSVPPMKREVTLSQLRENRALEEDRELRLQALALKDTMSARAAMALLTESEDPKDVPKAEVRWCQRLWQRAESGHADMDRRHEQHAKTTVMIPLIQALVLRELMGRVVMSGFQIAELINAELPEWEALGRLSDPTLRLPRPSTSTVEHWIERLPQSVKTVSRAGLSGWSKQERLTDRLKRATHANHIWQIDHTQIDTLLVLSAEQPTEHAVMHQTTCIDAFSGLTLASHKSSVYPDSETLSIVMADAIRPHEIAGQQVGGLPDMVVVDRGPDFKSSHFARIMTKLTIELELAAPHSPDQKAPVERSFRTSNQAMAKYPGHKRANGRSKGAARKRQAELMTVEQAMAASQRELDLHVVRPRGHGRPSPLEEYLSSWTPRWPTNLHDLDLLLLKDDEERVLNREGVRFRGQIYKGLVETDAGHAYQDLLGEKVIVRYHPDDQESILIYHKETGTRLGEFVNEVLWAAEGGAVVSNGIYRSQLVPRTTAYRKALSTKDRGTQKVERQRELEAKAKDRKAFAEREGLPAPTSRDERTTTKTRTADRRTEERRLDVLLQAVERANDPTQDFPILEGLT